MNIIDLTFTLDEIYKLFPCDEEDGKNVVVTPCASTHAAKALGVQTKDLIWHTPDVFSVRYGSSYVASAYCKGLRVRFQCEEGDFKEGDDIGWSEPVKC